MDAFWLKNLKYRYQFYQRYILLILSKKNKQTAILISRKIIIIQVVLMI